MKQYRIVDTAGGYRIEHRQSDQGRWERRRSDYWFLFLAKWKVKRLMSDDRLREWIWRYEEKVVWGPRP